MSVNWGEAKEVIENRKKFLAKLGLKYEDMVMASLLNGVEIRKVGKKDKGKYCECDAMITDEVGVGLWMVTADCLPVVFFDRKTGRLALAHLGWRGVNGTLAMKVVRKMVEMGSKVESIRIWIGPGVRKGTYKKWGKGWEEFKDEVGEGIKEWEDFLQRTREGFVILDLPGLVVKQLKSLGVEEKMIEVSRVDTVADINYYSHHRVHFTHETEGRFASVAMRVSH